MGDSRADEVRDALVDVLLKTLKDGVPVLDGEGNVHLAPAPAAYLSVAKDYVKAFPPLNIPQPSRATGILSKFLAQTSHTEASATGGALPFATLHSRTPN